MYLTSSLTVEVKMYVASSMTVAVKMYLFSFIEEEMYLPSSMMGEVPNQR